MFARASHARGPADGLCATGIGICLVSLVFLGSSGCGCSDDLPPGTPSEERECCCTFRWDFPFVDVSPTDVRIALESVGAGLEPRLVPDLLPQIGPSETGTFRLCIREDHPVGASLVVVFTDVNTSAELGRYRVAFDVACTGVQVEPLQAQSMLWSPDCGEAIDCCCTFLWLVPREAHNEDVNIVLDDVDTSLQTVVVTPPTLTNVQLDEYVQFEVCVDPNHTLSSGLNLRFHEADGTDVFSEFRLHYEDRCQPLILQPPPNGHVAQTELQSPDCGR